MTFKLLTEHDLEIRSLKGGCTDLSESTLVKMPHCWKSNIAAHFLSRIMVAWFECQFNEVINFL